MGRAEAKTIKSFMSRTTDRFRPPYGRMRISVERQCAFFGSCNEDEWNKDPTGGRRFWPIKCVAIDKEALWRERDQLWAEAVHRFKIGGPSAKWWIDEPDLIAAAADEQKARYNEDPWQAPIKKFIESTAISGEGATFASAIYARFGVPQDRISHIDWSAKLPPTVTVSEILSHLGIPDKERDQRHANRVAACLRVLG